MAQGAEEKLFNAVLIAKIAYVHFFRSPFHIYVSIERIFSCFSFNERNDFFVCAFANKFVHFIKKVFFHFPCMHLPSDMILLFAHNALDELAR